MDLGALEIILLSILILVSLWIFVKIYKRRTYREPGMKYSEHGHIWHRTDFIKMPTYCSSCEELCLNGRFCACCGIRVCSSEQCLQKMVQACKYVTGLDTEASETMNGNHGRETRTRKRGIPNSRETRKREITASSHTRERDVSELTDGPTGQPHHWTRGNLHLDSVCAVCHESCGGEPALVDQKCSWCLKTVHDMCFETAKDSPCSLGEFPSLLLPPSVVRLKIAGRGRGKRLVVTSLSVPQGISPWTPLLVMVNPRSGGQDGERVYSQLLHLLNPIQVVNLQETTPKDALRMCSLLPEASWRVAVCGGDGTVGWVLGAIDQANLPTPPAVGIIPLGTGNDLARVLGWGAGYEGEPLNNVLLDVDHAHVAKLDRWNVGIQGAGRFGIQGSLKTFIMNNYLGVGCDAGVALNFHNQRQSNPWMFASRYFNKAWYVGYGAKDVLEQSCKSLETKIEVWLDDKKLELPSLEGIVVLNINSWSAGVRVWSEEHQDGLAPSSFSDGLLEVIGLYSSLHVGRMQVKLDEAVRLGQARSVTILLRKTVPVQIDGEPWQQNASTIRIQHRCLSSVLINSSDVDMPSRSHSSASNLLNYVLESVTA